MLTPEQIKKIRENGLYDFLGNHGHELNKGTLITFFKEFNYAVYETSKEIEKEATEKALLEIIFS
jgi:hypothetical protein